MAHPRIVYAAVLAVTLLPSAGLAAQTASERLERLTSEAQERVFDLFPVSETWARGAGPRQDRLELTFTAAHRERQRAHHRWVLGELERIPLAELRPSEKLTHRLHAYRSKRALEALPHPFPQHYVFIHLNGGMAFDLVQLVDRQPLRNEADYRAWLTRLGRYPALFEGVGQILREGLEAKRTLPRPIVERSLAQLERLAPPEKDLAKSALWKPVTQFPASMDEAARTRFEADYRKLLVEEVLPALRSLAAFVRRDYLPQARGTDGLGAVPGGASMYAIEVRYATTTEMTPEEIHALGLREVRRIQASLLQAGEKAGFKGSIGELHGWLRSKPEHYPFSSGEEVLDYLNRLHARIVPQLPKFFAQLPKTRFEIRLTDPALAATTPAQWYPPSDDGTRPGIFYMPVVDARAQSVFGLASLLMHEGLPGHHLDGALKLESKLPEFRRRAFMTAFGEGWGLYAESLGHELGLYGEPLALMGRYSFELFRACRLVVDTGIHAKGWTREQAVRYMVEDCGSTPSGATLEVVRYMAWPGQALSYKIGEIVILELRAAAEARLGKRFDLRAFHAALLEEGHLPLSLLRERMESWISVQQKPVGSSVRP